MWEWQEWTNLFIRLLSRTPSMTILNKNIFTDTYEMRKLSNFGHNINWQKLWSKLTYLVSLTCSSEIHICMWTRSCPPAGSGTQTAPPILVKGVQFGFRTLYSIFKNIAYVMLYVSKLTAPTVHYSSKRYSCY